MLRFSDLHLLSSRDRLAELPEGKLLINTVNAWSFVLARKDEAFASALLGGDVLLPDGMGIVKACRWLHLREAPAERVSGWDLFTFEMEALERRGGGVCLFLGSSPSVLDAIVRRAAEVYPHIRVETCSPPYKPAFSEEEDRALMDRIHQVQPDLLWIGMTAPKQEKWIWAHWNELDIHCHCGTVGAVFDFFALTRRRAPLCWQRWGLEWLYRLLQEPRRMARRYLVGNIQFLWAVVQQRWGR